MVTSTLFLALLPPKKVILHLRSGGEQVKLSEYACLLGSMMTSLRSQAPGGTP